MAPYRTVLYTLYGSSTEQPEWSDLVPVLQDEEPHPIQSHRLNRPSPQCGVPLPSCGGSAQSLSIIAKNAAGFSV